MALYFENLPVFEYSGRTCRDITRRIALRRSVAADPRALRPYDVPAGQRPDQIADGYYGSYEREWLVFLSAEVIDPYFDWYLTDEQFSAYVLDKYGSLEEAVERVHHWQVDWSGTDQEISPQDYASLPDQLKKYYEPDFGQGTQVLSYSRREGDLTAVTNMVVTVEVDPSQFSEGERVQLRQAPGGSVEGQAEVAWANSTHVKLAQVQTSADPGLYMRGVASGEERVILSREFTSNTIPVEERPFWSPVTMIEWERDRNESQKSVRLVDSSFATQVELEMKRLLES